MKLLHTSDWHLGAMEGTISLKEDQKCFIDEICEIVKEKKIEGILLAGDVYHRAQSSSESMDLYDYAMTRLCNELSCKCFVIAGNHDGASRLANCNNLLSSAGLYVVGSLNRDLKAVKVDNAEIFFLPWITEEKVKSIFPEKSDDIHSLTDAYMVVTDEMRSKFTEGYKHIVISHAFITNAETSDSDRTAVIGFATQIPASVFKDFDYVALGHIHKPQKITENIRYCGTPMAYSFGKEESQKKRVIIIDTDTMEIEDVFLHPLHKRTTITKTLEELLHPQEDQDTIQGFVKLQATDSFIGLSMLSELRDIYPRILEASGKAFDDENSTINVSMDELQLMQKDPMELFHHFCMDVMKMEADEHLRSLFDEAVKDVEDESE